VQAPWLTSSGDHKAAVLKDLQHGPIIGQHIGNQLMQAGSTRNSNEMAHQDRTKSQALVLINHRKRNLGLSRLRDNVTTASSDKMPFPYR
jgi:hypothetical protein